MNQEDANPVATAQDVQTGNASVLDAPTVPKVDLPESLPRTAPRTVSARAREDLVRAAIEAGVPASRQVEHDRSKPHVHFRTKSFQFFSKVKVHRTKFQVRENLREAMLFAQVQGEGTIPVLFHKRPGMPYIAVLQADDLFRLMQAAEEGSGGKAVG